MYALNCYHKNYNDYYYNLIDFTLKIPKKEKALSEKYLGFKKVCLNWFLHYLV